MNVFHKVAKASLRNNRTRTFVTILGVILSAALITGVTIFGYSLLRTMAVDATLRYGDWHLAVTDVDDAFLDTAAQNNEVAAVSAYENTGRIALEGCKTPSKPYLYIQTFNNDTFATLPLTLLSGRLPQNNRELILSANLASEGGIGWKVGDTVSFPMNGTEVSYTIVGICSRLRFDHGVKDGYTAITYRDGFDPSASKTAFIKLNDPYSIGSYAQTITQENFYNEYVLRFMGIWKKGESNDIITLMLIVGLVVIGIIMVGSIFLIFNAFNISLNERTQQIGILSSVGATPKQLRSMVLYEGLCIGAVGIPLGALVGLGAIQMVIVATRGSWESILHSDIQLKLWLSFPILLGAALISLITILISAYIPAKKAAKTPVMECIRQTNEIKVSAKAVKTSKIFSKLWGLEGTLALKSFKRNKKQYRSIVLSLVLSIVLFVTTSSFVDSLTTVADSAKMVTDYDIGFGTQEMSDAEFAVLCENLKQVEGVTSSTMQAVYEMTIDVGSTPYTATIQFVDEASYFRLLEKWGLNQNEYMNKLPAVAKLNGDGATISDLPDLFSSKTVSATISGTSLLIGTLETLMPDIPPFVGGAQELGYTLQIVAPWSLKESIAGDMPVLTKGITFRSDDPSLSKEQIQAEIQGASVTAQYLLINNAEILSENQSFVFIANVFSYTFIVMISLIAVANVFNTISTNIKLRRRELAMIRSVGMSNRSFQQMMRFECVFYGLRAMLYGLPISLLLSYMVQKVMLDGVVDMGTNWFKVPWFSLSVGISTVLLIIFVTMMYTINKLKQENIIDALRDDMA